MSLDNLQSLRFFLPELTLTVAILVVILCDISVRNLRNVLNPLLTIASLLVALYFTLQLNQAGAATLFQGMVALDSFAQFFKVFLILAGLLVVLSSLHADELSSVHQGEFFALLLSVTLGMILMANSINL
ncbi:MAG TPA: hypothetical protein VHP35_02410, partial [Terriglobia bacterium]|nr:hypothetical protein [Terriglobia bacterium]